jgi:hypothetical protein
MYRGSEALFVYTDILTMMIRSPSWIVAREVRLGLFLVRLPEMGCRSLSIVLLRRCRSFRATELLLGAREGLEWHLRGSCCSQHS